MRIAPLLLAVTLAFPVALAAQTTPARKADLERFDVSGLPKTATTELEKEIFLLLRVHKKGDLTDATRIHMKLADYYKLIGEKAKAADCTKMAGEAWDAANGAIPNSAMSPGKPPFEPEGTFERTFTVTDEMKVIHTWQFYVDGTFSHSVTDLGKGEGPTELGWYTFKDGRMRLWQQQPSVDRTVPFELVGPEGKDGAVLDGVRMKSGS